MKHCLPVVCLALAAAGCAAKSGVSIPVAGEQAAPTQPAESYQLTAEEQGLDCKKLTGRMQVRILQERDYTYRRKASTASQTVQSAVSTIGSSSRGLDPDAEHRKSVAQLEAYNARLAAKGCKTFDLAKELEPKPVTVTPTPLAKPGSEPGKTKRN